jgi:hypothetical protein
MERGKLFLVLGLDGGPSEVQSVAAAVSAVVYWLSLLHLMTYVNNVQNTLVVKQGACNIHCPLRL